MINAFYNGIFSDFRDVEIPLSDRSIFFGDAVYEMMLGRHRTLYDLEAHKSRLLKSCAAVKIVPPRELDEVVSQLIKMNDFECFLLYVQVSRVSAKREHAPKGAETPSLLVFIDEAHPEEYRKPVSLITANDIRGEMCNVKCVNLLPNVLASREASEAGADEAVFVRNGTVTEGSKSNCLILSRGVLKTHPTGRHILPGTIRAKALSLAPTLGIRVLEVPFTTADMMAADEVLISSSTKLIRRAAVIDGCSVGGRDTDAAKALQDALYRDFLSKTE